MKNEIDEGKKIHKFHKSYDVYIMKKFTLKIVFNPNHFWIYSKNTKVSMSALLRNNLNVYV